METPENNKPSIVQNPLFRFFQLITSSCKQAASAEHRVINWTIHGLRVRLSAKFHTQVVIRIDFWHLPDGGGDAIYAGLRVWGAIIPNQLVVNWNGLIGTMSQGGPCRSGCGGRRPAISPPRRCLHDRRSYAAQSPGHFFCFFSLCSLAASTSPRGKEMGVVLVSVVCRLGE